MVWSVATGAVFVCMILLLVRLFAGVTLYDRVLALNTFGTCTVLLIGTTGFLFERPDFLDIALLYALMNFVGTIAVLKFFRYRRIGDDFASEEEQQMVMEEPVPETREGTQS